MKLSYVTKMHLDLVEQEIHENKIKKEEKK